MDRRQFLFASSAVAVGGCGRKPAAVPTTPATAINLPEQAARRAEHLARLERFRVPATATRTTPAPPVVVPDVFPPLKPLVKFTIRLHTRFGDEPATDATKVGGRFAWPAEEPHPTGFAPVLQLRADDAPSQFAFRPHTDLMQLVWDPSATARVFWRKRADCSGPPLVPPSVAAFPADLLPVPCVVFPEKVAEYPPPDLMPRHMREQIEKWTPPTAGEPGPRFFADRLASAPGVKLGGWPHWTGTGTPNEPACPSCKRLMDYLMTVASGEWDDRTKQRWQPTEERDAKDAEGYRSAAGLRLGANGTGSAHLFVCRRCEDWPVRVVQ